MIDFLSFGFRRGSARSISRRRRFPASRSLELLEPRSLLTGFVTASPTYAVGVVPGVTTQPILTVGDVVPQTGDLEEQYRFTGIPDGAGVYDNGDGTLTMFVNHEFAWATTTNPFVGGAAEQGAYVSKLIVDKGTLGVISADIAYDQIFVDDNPTPVEGFFGRFCSGFLAGPEVGFDTYIYLAGEEAAESFTGGQDTFDGLGGVTVGIVDGKAYVLTDLGHFPWENQVVLPNTGDLTVVIGLEDGPSTLDSQLYMYVGEKVAGDANPVVRNGLVGGKLYVFKSDNVAKNDENTVHKVDGTISGSWVEIVAADTLNETQLETAADAVDAFDFLRLEDGASDRNTPGRFYFATTGSTTKNASNQNINKLGRIYQLDLDPENPTGATSLKVLLEGDAGDPIVNPDNLDINPLDQMVIQEDNNSEHRGSFLAGREASLWLYDVNTGALQRIAEIDQTAVPNTAGFRDAVGVWETSGVTDLSSIYGVGNWLFDVQAHSLNSLEASQVAGSGTDLGLGEGGQLLLLNTANIASSTDPNLSVVGRYVIGTNAAAEISAYDAVSQRLFVLNSPANKVDIVDLADPANPTKVGEISLAAFGAAPNSVAAKNGLVAVAVEAAVKQNPGQVAFFTTGGTVLGSVTVGALPDMLTFTPDGTKVVVANEGEPDNYSSSANNDPEGSVSIIDLSGGLIAATVTTAGFTDFNVGESRNAELPADVRIFGLFATVAEDLEPEYVAISPDSTTAFVTLQENNALATINLSTGVVTSITSLGFKNHSTVGNSLDASDRDTNAISSATPSINILNQPIFGMYQPDAIASFVVDGTMYLVTANEGDARDYTGFNEESRVASLDLDDTVFPNEAALKNNASLGRLTVTNTLGKGGDADFEEIYVFGGRSFSIRATDGTLVYDSGNLLEIITAQSRPAFFNSDGSVLANGTAATFDTRSDNKGPEPEAAVTGVIDGTPYAFIGLERTNGVMMFDVSLPAAPRFVQYLVSPGDVGPEGLQFISAADSPNGRPLVLVSSEISGTVTIMEVSLPSTLTLTDGSVTFTEGEEPVAIDSALTISDADSTTLASATVTITNPLDGTEFLEANTTGTPIAASFDPTTWQLSLRGTATLAQYQQVLRSVSYSNDSKDPNLTPRVVRFEIRDDKGNASSDAAIVHIVGGVNDAATTEIEGPESGVRGQPLHYTLTATDPDAGDTEAGFTFTINWGDGSPIETTDAETASGLQLTHIFTSVGTFNVTVTSTDRNGDESEAAELTVEIVAAQMQGSTLIVGGTPLNDDIALEPNGANTVRVKFRRITFATFTSVTGIELYGQAGNDRLTAQVVNLPTLMDGGAGNDHITGGRQNDTLIGAAGADLINGGDGDDLLLGDAGNDVLNGGRGDDVIDGGGDRDNLSGNDGNDSMRGGLANDTLRGGNGDDLLIGSEGNDSLVGDNGADTLVGDDGVDTLLGGSGIDTINGVLAGLGHDVVIDSTKIIDLSFTFNFDELLEDLL